MGAGRRPSLGLDERERETKMRGIREKNRPERKHSWVTGYYVGYNCVYQGVLNLKLLCDVAFYYWWHKAALLRHLRTECILFDLTRSKSTRLNSSHERRSRMPSSA